MSQQQPNKRVRLAGLWRNVSKSGEEYFTGKLGNLKIIIFANKQKQSDRAPDYNMYIEEVPFEGQARQASPVASGATPPQTFGSFPQSTFNEDDLAF